MSRHFKDSELECKCGCGLNNFSDDTLTKFDIAREYAQVPFVINSACRCEKHNKEVGGKEDSSHVLGKALDIKATDSRTRARVLYGLVMAGFNRIGIAKTFIHADDDDTKPSQVVWLY